MAIAVMAADGMFDSGLSVTLDILAAANALRDDHGVEPPLEVTVVGVASSVRTGHGLTLQTTPLSELSEAPEILVLPAVGLVTPERVVEIVDRHDSLTQITGFAEAGSSFAAACSGTFFLGEAGVLDGRRATTSWWLGPTFRSRYPDVKLDESSTLTIDGDVTTAGSAFAHIDLALSLVQRHSPALAETVARHLLIGNTPTQAIFAVPSLLASADPIISAFEQQIRAHLADPVPVSELAAAIGVGERTLQRATASVLGMSPLDFVREVRLDQATHLLRSTDRSVESIAAAVGYRNAGTLRALVRERRGTTISALRHRDRRLGGALAS